MSYYLVCNSLFGTWRCSVFHACEIWSYGLLFNVTMKMPSDQSTRWIVCGCAFDYRLSRLRQNALFNLQSSYLIYLSFVVLHAYSFAVLNFEFIFIFIICLIFRMKSKCLTRRNKYFISLHHLLRDLLPFSIKFFFDFLTNYLWKKYQQFYFYYF